MSKRKVAVLETVVRTTIIEVDEEVVKQLKDPSKDEVWALGVIDEVFESVDKSKSIEDIEWISTEYHLLDENEQFESVLYEL